MVIPKSSYLKVSIVDSEFDTVQNFIFQCWADFEVFLITDSRIEMICDGYLNFALYIKGKLNKCGAVSLPLTETLIDKLYFELGYFNFKGGNIHA